MHILCTGAAGMIGRKLTARLHKDGVLGGLAITVAVTPRA
jgi:nucleoside-diphosphate-sugar epimerase